MNHRTVLLLGIASSMGCDIVNILDRDRDADDDAMDTHWYGDESDYETDDESEPGSTQDPSSDPQISVDWGSSSVSFRVDGGPGGYWLGMVEVGCGNQCWTGEDCVWGYELSSGEVVGPYCHDLGDGGTTVLTYGGSPNNLQTGTTVFSRALQNDVAYFLESDPNFGGDGRCWVWGNGTSYYDGLGCQSP